MTTSLEGGPFRGIGWNRLQLSERLEVMEWLGRQSTHLGVKIIAIMASEQMIPDAAYRKELTGQNPGPPIGELWQNVLGLRRVKDKR